MLEVAVTPAADSFEVRRVGEEFVAGGYVNSLAVEGDATKAAVPPAALPVDIGFIPIDGLADRSIVEIDQVNTAVTVALVAAANNGGRYEFQKLFRTVRLRVRGFCNERDSLKRRSSNVTP